MRKNLLLSVAFVILLVMSAKISLGAGAILTNGGLGQSVATPEQFGVAVCNGDTQALTTSVPILLDTGSESTTIESVPSIAPDQCAYNYLDYSALGMQPGLTYTVTVTIDPQQTVITNSDNQTEYDITVPKQVALVNSNSLLANVGSELSAPFIMAWHWITSVL